MKEKSAIILVNWNGSEDTIECLQSIIEWDKYNYIYLLDNGSELYDYDKLKNWIENNYHLSYKEYSADEFEAEKGTNFYFSLVRSTENLGFSKGNNFILRNIYSQFTYCTLLNNDTILIEDSITQLRKHMNENKNIAMMSCKIQKFPDTHLLWNAGGKFKWYGDRKYFSEKYINKCIKRKEYLIDTPFITGCVLMFRKETIEKYGFLTEQFFFGEEDFNYCMVLKRENEVVKTCLDTTVYHKVSSSIKKVAAGEIVELRRAILHYSNRIINMKNFYSLQYWKFWRYLYIYGIAIRMICKRKKWSSVQFFLNKTLYYSKKNNEIDFNLFKEINSLEI